MTRDDFRDQLFELIEQAKAAGLGTEPILGILTGALTVEAVAANLGSRLLGLMPRAFAAAARALPPPAPPTR